MKTNKKGISLIVLVITIIVMIILATAIILSISGSDVRGKAEEAVSQTDMATAKEVVAVAYSDWELNYDDLKDDYDDFEDYATKKLKKAGINNVKPSNEGAVNVVYTDKNGDTAVIPEGFSVSTVKSEQTIDDGLVIVDKKGNEFVWVPVDNYARFQRTTTYNPEEDITDPGDDYTEPYNALSLSNDPTGEWKEWTAMTESVKENKGFYIARYEAGKEGTETVVSKKGATVWNYISWGESMQKIGTTGAVYRARQMYKGSKSVVSTLCYGVQWDAALQFISTKDATYVTNSANKGNYTGTLINTGSNDDYAVNNIYDMAGNIGEWTMEVFEDYDRIFRGGFPGSTSAPSLGTRFSDGFMASAGFRVALYIK